MNNKSDDFFKHFLQKLI